MAKVFNLRLSLDQSGFGFSERAQAVNSLLFLAPSAYPLGGVAVWLDYLLPGLAQRGFHCTLGLTCGEYHDADRYLKRAAAVPVSLITNKTGSAEGRRRSIVACIEKNAPDVVLGVNVADAFDAMRRIRQSGCGSPKFIMTVHGIESDLFADMRSNEDLIDGVIASNRLACALSSGVGQVSLNRIHYAPYGVKTDETGDTSVPGPRDSFRISWVGRIEQAQKRVFDVEPILDRLVAVSGQYRMQLVGDGPDRCDLERRLMKLTGIGCIEWSGVVPSREMCSRVYRTTDALLVTSAWETGPIVIWEAMAAGVPVVSSRYTGAGLEGALRNDENCLLFDVGDAEGAAAAIQRLRDPSVRSRLAAAGRELVRDRYSINTSVSSWANGIRSVIGASTRICRAERAPNPSGRLDRLLGVGLAESVRSLAGIRFRHWDCGGEWPHSNSPPFGRDELWRKARAVDYPGTDVV